MRLRILPLVLFLLPLIEIAGFVVVGRQVGVLWTVALVVASTVLGSVLLRHQGFGVVNRVRAEMQAGRDPSREMAHGIMIVLAALLLVIPGFVSDIFGLLLFVPPVRELAWRFLKRRVDFSADFVSMGGMRAQRERGRTIDLDEDDYSSSPGNPGSPWNRIPRK